MIRGEAHGNAIGGFQPSVEPQNFVSGNYGYGIAVMDRAYNNSIFHTKIGLGALNVVVPNLAGGVLLNMGTTGYDDRRPDRSPTDSDARQQRTRIIHQ